MGNHRLNEAVKKAQEAAQAAGAAQSAAEAAKAGAETARDGAKAAQHGADQAQAGAQAAEHGAQTAEQGAQAARASAQSARDGAVAAKKGADAARQGAQAAQHGAQAAEQGANAAAQGAANAKTGAETARDEAAAARDAAAASALLMQQFMDEMRAEMRAEMAAQRAAFETQLQEARDRAAAAAQAADDAKQAQAQAEGARDQANDARDAAAQSSVAAEVAQGRSEAAQRQAEAARDEAQRSATSASTSATAAAQAKADAVAARDEAVAAKNAALDVSGAMRAIDPGFGSEGHHSSPADPTDKPTRLTMHVPTYSTVLSLGAPSHEAFDGWTGTWQGVTIGTKDTVGVAAGNKFLAIAAPLTSTTKTTHTMADEAAEHAEAGIKTHEWIGLCEAAVEIIWFMTPSPGTVLGATLWAKTLASLTGEQHHGVAQMHGEAEAIVSSNKTVISYGGDKNLVIGGVLAELSGGVTAEVKGLYSAGMTALGTVEMRAVGKAEVLADHKAELVARRGTAEVLGRFVEIGSIASEFLPVADTDGVWTGRAKKTVAGLRWAAYARNQPMDTEVVGLHANTLIEGKVGHSAVEVTTRGVDLEAGHSSLLAVRPDMMSMNVQEGGVCVTPTKVELGVKPPPAHHWGVHPPAATARNTSIKWGQGLAALGNTAATGMLLGGVLASDSTAVREGLALGAAVATSLGELVASAKSLAAETKYAGEVAEAKENALTGAHGYWHGPATHARVTVENGVVTLAVEDAKVEVGAHTITAEIPGAGLTLVNQADAVAAATTRFNTANAQLPLRVASVAAARGQLATFNAAYIAARGADAKAALLPRRQELRDAIAARTLLVAQAQQEVVDATAYLATQQAIRAGLGAYAVLRVGTSAIAINNNGVVKLNNAAGQWAIAANGAVDVNNVLQVLNA